MRWLPVLRAVSTISFVASIALGVLSFRAVDDSRRWVVGASNGLMSFSLAERTLQVDLLDARAGLLRNYDPINVDLAEARASLRDMEKLRLRPEARARLLTLETRAAEQEGVVEGFKSDNALLQNSLSRFTTGDPAVSRSGAGLSARVLRLTLDTSPQTVREAKAALARTPHPAEGTPTAQLISHARLLIAIVPAIDARLYRIRNLGMESRIEALQAVLRQETRSRQMAALRLQALLAAVLLLCTASTITLVIMQRLRTRELGSQAASERLSAAIATPLIDTGREAFVSRVQEAVHRLGLHVAAKRLQLIIPDVLNLPEFSWPEQDLDPDWLRRLVDAADADAAWQDGKVIASRSNARLGRALGRAMLGAGVRDLVLLRTEKPHRVIVGFEPGGSATAPRSDHVAGVGSAIVAIAHGARRETMLRERERLERRLARSRRMEVVGAMASGIAHNFNNIIGAIGGFAEMGQDRTRQGTRARQSLDEIQGAVKRAQDLVEDILSFSRQGRSNKRRTSVAEVLAQAVRLLSASARNSDAFTLSLPRTCLLVMGAEGDLQQVVLNICNNASHASCGRPVTIAAARATVGEEQKMSHGVLEPGPYVVVTIADDGPGIPTWALPRLFEPFFTTKAGGTGLGLSTAWEIVQEHGGTIHVQGGPGGGTEFAIWLPEMSQEPCDPRIPEGAQVLLLAEADRLAEEEELLAELGYEPLGFALDSDLNALRHVLPSCEAVVVATPKSELAGSLAMALDSLPGGRPLLLVTREPPSTRPPSSTWIEHPGDAGRLAAWFKGSSAIAQEAPRRAHLVAGVHADA